MEDYIYDLDTHALLMRDGSPVAKLSAQVTASTAYKLADRLNGIAQLELESQLVQQHNKSVLLEARIKEMESYSRGLAAEVNQLSDKNYD